MAKSVELLWLDSIDARDRGDMEEALELARKVVEQDEAHAEAWMAIAPISSLGTVPTGELKCGTKKDRPNLQSTVQNPIPHARHPLSRWCTRT